MSHRPYYPGDMAGFPEPGVPVRVKPLVGVKNDKLADMADGTVKSNFSGRLDAPSDNTPDAALIQRTYYASSTSGTATYTATVSPVPTGYVTGAQYAVTVTSANTGASTMNFNSLGAKTIQANGAALLAGQLQAGVTYQMIYDGTNLQVTNNVILVTQTFKNLIVKPADEARFSNVTPADDTDLKVTLLSGKTYNITIVASFNAATTGMHLKANSAFTGTTSQLWVNGTLSVTSNIVSAGRAALNNHLSYTPGTVDANTPVCAIFNAMLITTSTGVFSMQWSQGITSVSNLTCLAGSYLWAISN